MEVDPGFKPGTSMWVAGVTSSISGTVQDASPRNEYSKKEIFSLLRDVGISSCRCNLETSPYTLHALVMLW